MRALRAALYLLLFVAGSLAGAGAAFYMLELRPSPTVMYRVVEPLHLSNGVVLPVGTELGHRWSAPEGFEQLCLGVNVGGEELKRVSRHLEPQHLLFVPYWAVSPGE